MEELSVFTALFPGLSFYAELCGKVSLEGNG